jgi:hypothetical protein
MKSARLRVSSQADRRRNSPEDRYLQYIGEMILGVTGVIRQLDIEK